MSEIEKVDRLAEFTHFAFRIPSIKVDHSKKSVTASIFGILQATASYCEGIGCILSPKGTNPEEVTCPSNKCPSVLKIVRKMREENEKRKKSNEFFPVGNKMDPNASRMNVLGPVLEKFFDESFPGTQVNTRSILVVKDGQLIGEKHFRGYRNKKQLGWSMSKSVTSALIGVAVKKGIIELDSPIEREEWKKHANYESRKEEYKKITWRELLDMSTGLGGDENYDIFGEPTRMLFVKGHSLRNKYFFNFYFRKKKENLMEALEEKPLLHYPNTYFMYNSLTTNLLLNELRKKVGEDCAYFKFPFEELFLKGGMYSAHFETDSTGNFIGSSFIFMEAADWARFGMIFAQNGTWDGKRVLPEGWVDFSRQPATTTSLYGKQWWLNTHQLAFPSLPENSLQASGFEYQARHLLLSSFLSSSLTLFPKMLYVHPEENLVVVRLGCSQHITPGWSEERRNELVSEIRKALGLN